MNNLKRIKIVKWLLTSVFLIFLVYIFLLQTVYSKKFRRLAQNQHCDSIPLLAERGKIFDTKHRPLVYNQMCASVRILPQYVRCRDSVATLLASYNLKPKNDIVQEINKNKRLYWFKKYVDYEIASKLKKELRSRRFDNSIIVADDIKRIYPFGASLASVIGVMGEENGLAGIEFAFDKYLRGKPGCIILQKDAIGNDYYWPSYPMIQPVNGSDITLTIDLDIQEITYQQLSKYVEQFQAIRGSVLVLDCNDGSILAMCDYPDYEPQDYKNYPINLWSSIAISDEFEPGSVYKLVICATALESKNTDFLTSQKYDVSKGFITISGRKIKDVHNNGIIDFDNIFIKSSNIGVSILSQNLSNHDFYLAGRRFGFGIPTAIELPGEATGLVDKPNKLTPLRFANNAFGQGLRATLLQLSMAYLTVAQNGFLLKPYIIKEINQNGKTIYRGEKKVVRRVLSEKNSLTIKDILVRVTREGTGRAAAIENYPVCGKTGTSQKLEPDGKYSSKKSMMTFIGFFPKDNPQYLIAVYIDEPKISRFAGEVTCPLFRDIGSKIISLINPKTFPPNKDLTLR